MSQKIDIKGKKFGKLFVQRPSGSDSQGKALWLCLCDCGTEVTVSGVYLRNGHTQSCGCLSIERSIETSTTHGHFSGGKQTRLYAIWAGMKRRCLNPHVKIFKHYGGRGIAIYPAWLEFEAFKKWALSNGYQDDLTIDRIDNDGNYEPGNCRWITKSENSRKGAIESHKRKQEATGVPTYASQA